MNTNQTALDTYTAKVNDALGIGTMFDNELLIKQRARLAGIRQRLATLDDVAEIRTQLVGVPIQTAGLDFLEAIHQEILDNEPQWKKDLREREIDLERISNEKAACAEVAAMPGE